MGHTDIEQLQEVNNAIEAVLVVGQSYKIGTRNVTKADLGLLLNMRKDLEARIANQDRNLMDNTYLAVFEGR